MLRNGSFVSDRPDPPYLIYCLLLYLFLCCCNVLYFAASFRMLLYRALCIVFSSCMLLYYSVSCCITLHLIYTYGVIPIFWYIAAQPCIWLYCLEYCCTILLSCCSVFCVTLLRNASSSIVLHDAVTHYILLHHL